jgi:hypothetical protein
MRAVLAVFLLGLIANAHGLTIRASTGPSKYVRPSSLIRSASYKEQM